MSAVSRCAVVVVLVTLFPAAGFAQGPSGRERPRPAPATTVAGDSGLWFVSAAEVLPAGALDAGVLAASESRDQAQRKASYGAMSVARGLGGRAELFASWQMPIEVDGRRGPGDLIAGAKLNLLSQHRGAPVALAARTVLKLPTADEAAGLGSGAADLLTELVASRRFGRAEITGSGGVVWRGDHDDVESPNGIRSGIGAALLAHRSLRLFTEVSGERYRGGSPAGRLVSPFDTPPTAAAGLSWSAAESLVVGAGVTRAIGGRDEGRGFGVGVRIGYRPGVRRAGPVVSPPHGPTTGAAAPASPPRLPRNGSAGAGAAGTTSARDLVLEDVHFDLDRATLRPEALVVLDRAVAALREDPALRLQLDGHTCEIGTIEYNLALGERRATSVRSYLVSRGIAIERLQMTSFGEQRPKHDMRAEATRALNRRVELRPLSSRDPIR